MGYLRLRDVIKSYDGKTNAVDGVNIAVERGEFVTLLGPSGSGKTTTLMMIAGFEQPTGGTIELANENLTDRKPYQRNVGMVFQNYALFPHMSALKNVAFPLRMRHFPRDEVDGRAHKMLDLVGLGRFAHRFPRELSGGQQQRVALARGLVFNPSVLLLDEPLGALDKNLREQMQVEIKRIHREVGITMIYVTHDQTEAMTMSDRVAVFREGRIEQLGSPIEVYDRPVNRFVAEFVGDSNFFAGRADPARPGVVELDSIGQVRVGPDVSASGAVDIMIRPERLRLTTTGEVDNTFDMLVADVINYGDSILVIGTTHGLPLRARLLSHTPAMLQPGTRLRLAWSPADARVLARR